MGSEDEKLKENFLSNQLYYKVFFKNIKNSEYTMSYLPHYKMADIAKDNRINKNIQFFYRFLEKDNGVGQAIDRKLCYLGDILYYDDLYPEQLDIHMSLQNSKEFLAKSNKGDYAVIRLDGTTFVPDADAKVKVFNKNLNLMNKQDPDDIEHFVQDFLSQYNPMVENYKKYLETKYGQTNQGVNTRSFLKPSKFKYKN